jgi:hypothetical protein
VWNYTPRRIQAFTKLAERRNRHEDAARLSLHANAARGDASDIKRKVREMTRD